MSKFDKITAEDLQGVKDDAHVSLEELNRRLGPGNATEIEYGTLAMRVENHMIEHARDVITKLTPIERKRLMFLTDRALRTNMPKIAAGKLSKKRCDAAADDLVMWHVLKAMSD